MNNNFLPCNICNGGPLGHKFDCPTLDVGKKVQDLPVVTCNNPFLEGPKMFTTYRIMDMGKGRGEYMRNPNLAQLMVEFGNGNLDQHESRRYHVQGLHPTSGLWVELMTVIVFAKEG